MSAQPDVDELSEQSWDLSRLLYNRRWVWRAKPFPHIVAQDVFVPEFYRSLEDDFERIQNDPDNSFARNMGKYDASSVDLAHHRDGPLGIFVSRAWLDLLADISGVAATGDIHATLHHHEVGSASGWPHNDLSPAWFEDPEPGPDEVRHTARGRVDYGHGPVRPEVSAHETIRAVSVLYYLHNDAWTPGDGGETALFASCADARRDGPAATVAPLNNSLVLFECTPFSWHTFLRNTAHTRDSMVMWIHRRKDEVVERWGEPSIAYWK